MLGEKGYVSVSAERLDDYGRTVVELRTLKSDLRKLVEDLRIGGKSLSPDATHAYMFCADKIEKLLNRG